MSKIMRGENPFMRSEHKQKQGINCSQELNSRIWHELAGGAGYDDVREIYEDVCKLSILSNMEIDLLVSAYRNVRKN